MVSMRLAGSCGAILASSFLLAPAQAQQPLPQETKDKIKQIVCLNQHWLPHTQRTWNKHGIPAANYTEVMLSTSVATLPGVTTTIAIPGKAETLLGKIFRLNTPTVQLDHIRLDQAGLAIQENGQLQFSARLLNQGGKQGELLGNNVTVVLRAHAGQNSEGPPSILPRTEGAVGGPAVWETSKSLWLAANQPQTISISPASVDGIRQNFQKITGFDVGLQYEKGR